MAIEPEQPATNLSHGGNYITMLVYQSVIIYLNPQENLILSHSITIWLFNIAMENLLYMEVSSWENHLFSWDMASMAMSVITKG